ncbi:MAG: molecular chaperone HtpG [Erysipelotrichaceae bacterium]
MAKKQFKAESKRLLDLMINSIYTHKEIFLRELISNASDAIDKLYYLSLTNDQITIKKDSLEIFLEVNEGDRTITIKDNGIGLSKEDLQENLGTIAKSGSLDFKTNIEGNEDVDIIGQFGVGFYSAFMVAKSVEVITKKYDSDVAYSWISDGVDGYTINESSKDEIGTTIILTLKDDSEDDKYSEYLSEYRIKDLIKRYSDYIRYPIKMYVNKQVKKADSDEYDSVKELETLNSMIPLWKRNKNDIKKEEYDDFYKDNFMDFNDPLKVIHFNVEGNISFDSLLYIPSKAPYNYYTKDFEKGLKLYSRNVFIMDKASDLVPEYFRFVKGLVDSMDLSLNISREMLQHDRQLKAIAGKVEKKIKSELLNMLNNERDLYVQFYKEFGIQLKYGVYSDYGMHKDTLQDLLMFYSSSEKELVTLKEYVDRMKEGQEFIYYASGSSVDKIDKLPQLELLKDKGYEILYLSDDVDEFALQMLMKYNEKSFKSANQGDLNLEDEATKEEVNKVSDDNKGMLELIKEALKGKVDDVIISKRLKTAPVCLSSKEGLSMEMEKVLSQMPDGSQIKAEKVLEINHGHDLFKALTKVYNKDASLIDEYASLLYNQALMIEGFSVEDPIDFSNKMVKLMIDSAK